MRILVCGGAGYSGSHTCTVLAGRGHDLLVADSFVNSSPRALERLRRLVDASMRFRQADLSVRAEVEALFAGPRFDAVVHFAALKAVGASDRKSTRLKSSPYCAHRMPSFACKNKTYHRCDQSITTSYSI